jgi:pyruvate/2-oxoglutarate dehydrogenase complex dihydrolipoamide dehydrogenase (E3) component
MNTDAFDAIVVGGGSAGYAAARTFHSAGWTVAVVEGSPSIGGLCILRGCMPTKALLHAAELRHAMEEARIWGMDARQVELDFERLMARKDELIADFALHRRNQLSDGRFAFFHETARFVDSHTIKLSGGRRLTARHFAIATGSTLAPSPLPQLNEVGYLTSDTALSLRQLPTSLIVLGGGPVALEFAQFFHRLGTRVTLIQRSAHVLREADVDVAHELEAALRQEGMTILTGTEIASVQATAQGKAVTVRHAGNLVTVEASEIFNGLGRVPATEGLGLEAAGVKLKGSGHILTDAHQRTSQHHIIAAGDCAGPHEIVHIAIQQAETGARHLLHPGKMHPMDYRLLVSVVFTEPQVAMVGATERSLHAHGISCRVATYPFNDHGKSMILGARHGFVKLITAAATGEILGAACVGPQGGELIHEIVVAMSQRMTAAQLAAVPHYHPTLAEIWTYPAEELAG